MSQCFISPSEVDPLPIVMEAASGSVPYLLVAAALNSNEQTAASQYFLIENSYDGNFLLQETVDAE